MRIIPLLALAAAAAHLHVFATGPSRGDAPTGKDAGTTSGVADSESFPDSADVPDLPPPVDRLHNWGIYEPARCVITSMGSFWWDGTRRMFWASPNGRRAPHIDSANTFGTTTILNTDPIRHGLVADWVFDTAMQVEGQPWRDLIPVLRLRGDDAPPCRDAYRAQFLLWDASRIRQIGEGDKIAFVFTDETARYIRGLEGLVVAVDRFINGRDTIDRTVYLPATEEFLRAKFSSVAYAQDEFTRWVRDHLIVRGMLNTSLDVAQRRRIRSLNAEIWRNMRQVEWFGHGYRGVGVTDYAANKDLIDLYITLDVPVYYPWPEGGAGVAQNHRPHPTVVTEGVNDWRAAPDVSKLSKKAGQRIQDDAINKLAYAAWGFAPSSRPRSGAPGASGSWDPGDAALGVGQPGYKKGQAKAARKKIWFAENQPHYDYPLTNRDYENRNEGSSEDDDSDDFYMAPLLGYKPDPRIEVPLDVDPQQQHAPSSSKRPREDEQLRAQESPKRPRQELPAPPPAEPRSRQNGQQDT